MKSWFYVRQFRKAWFHPLLVRGAWFHRLFMAEAGGAPPPAAVPLRTLLGVGT